MEQPIASGREDGHFAHVASHDMQEHLRMVLTFNALLMEEFGASLDDRARRYLSLSLGAARQMQELLNDLLEFGRVGAGMDGARAFDADAELARVLEGLTEMVRISQADIAAGPLPRLFGNPVRFRRLLQNLIANAIKYASPQTAPVIRVTAREEAASWRFCVADNGVGIAPACREKIFEPFTRLHTDSRHAGTGLGLAICREIVAGFGGRIWVEAAPGGGSAFHFTVRRKDPGDDG